MPAVFFYQVKFHLFSFMWLLVLLLCFDLCIASLTISWIVSSLMVDFSGVSSMMRGFGFLFICVHVFWCFSFSLSACSFSFSGVGFFLFGHLCGFCCWDAFWVFSVWVVCVGSAAFWVFAVYFGSYVYPFFFEPFV